MSKLESKGLQFLGLAAIMIFGLSFAASGAKAESMTTSQAELIQRVQDTNVGWDWVPTCGDGAFWSTGSSKCKAGSGSGEKNFNHHHVESYGLSSMSELLAKVEDINVGWNWEPKCGDGAHWTWGDDRCKGGSGD